MFGPAPLVLEVERGRAVARRGQGLERCFHEARKPIGWWFSGKNNEDVEQVIWMSPKLVSRWLGYLDEREKWVSGRLDSQWREVGKVLSGRISLIVQIASFPSASLSGLELEFGLAREPEPIMFVVETGGLRFEPKVDLLVTAQARNWRTVDRYPWYQALPFAAPLRPFGDEEPNLLPLGSFFGQWWLVTFDPMVAPASLTFTLHAVSKSKVRTVTFPTN